ncbi:MAG: hypothetical protein A2W25_02695 [candidate division Zixibacteria bacterium RBG_16_53_22]|nr:MAG: hypothetical protein A2W25_02695 [candidate division Zixibacteria bacterium RBG_16_53_22]
MMRANSMKARSLDTIMNARSTTKENQGGRRILPSAVRKAVFKMKNLTTLAMVILVASMSVVAYADRDDYDNGRGYWYRSGNTPEIDVWTNKGHDARYYFGEDVAVYFRAEDDCYVVVYDVDPSGNVSILFPSSHNGSSYVEGGRVYRVPDYGDDFRLEIAGGSGDEHIFAVASYDYINPPDFMKYVGYDYGDDSYYDDDYFAIKVRGSLDNFVGSLNARICSGPYVVAHTRFLVDTNYRHHRHYRYWDYDPYYVGSIWIGCDYPGSEIWIDGIFIGIAPILVPRVMVGYHWVWVYYGGYPCYQRYFYVPSYQRFYIDVRIDHRYHDYKFRRRAFRDWVFEEKKYRNEDGFRENAREIRQKNVRNRPLPATIVRDYADRGVISREAPIVKQIRTKDVERDSRPIEGGRNLKPESPRIQDRDAKGPRTRSVEPGDDKRTGKVTDQMDRMNKGSIDRDEGRIIVPEGKPDSERKRLSGDKGDMEKTTPRDSWQGREDQSGKRKSESQINEQRNERQEGSKDRKVQSNREEGKSSSQIKEEDKSGENSSRKESSRNSEKKESRSSKKASKTDRSRERGR